MKSIVSLSITLSVLSACVSSTPPSEPSPPAPRPETGIKITAYDAKTNTFTIVADGHEIALKPDSEKTRSGSINVEAFSDGLQPDGSLPEFVVYKMVSGSGETSMNLALRTSVTNWQGYPDIKDAALGSAVSYNAPTNMPSTGTANFQGSYVGGLSPRTLTGFSGEDTAYEVVYGDVALDVDFGTSTISGKITDRVAEDSTLPGYDKHSLSDVTLQTAAIDPTGEYSGTALKSGDTGSYFGVLSGDNATETAGVFIIEQGSDYFPNEYGVFLAVQP